MYMIGFIVLQLWLMCCGAIYVWRSVIYHVWWYDVIVIDETCSGLRLRSYGKLNHVWSYDVML